MVLCKRWSRRILHRNRKQGARTGQILVRHQTVLECKWQDSMTE